MNYNKKTQKAVKPPVVVAQPRPISITNWASRSTLINSANLTDSESGKAYDFFKIHGTTLPVGTDFGSYLKQKLGDIHYEKVGNTASIRLSQEKRIEFTQKDVAAVIADNPMQIEIGVTNVGVPTYAH